MVLASWYVLHNIHELWPTVVVEHPYLLVYLFAVPWELKYLIYAWPAFAVFAWLPLFALGIVTARLLTPLSWIVGRTQWFLKEGKEHPLKAIGYVAAVVVFLGTVGGREILPSTPNVHQPTVQSD